MSLFQNELPINTTTRDSNDSPNGSEIGEQVQSEDRNVGGKDSSTQPILASEPGNHAEDVETCGHDGVHPRGEDNTANDVRGQEGIAENAEEAESSVHGQTDQDTKTRGASGVSQNVSLVRGNGPQEAGSKDSSNHEAGIHGSGAATQETTPQREGEGRENQGAEVTPSIREDAGFGNAEGSPSGNGVEEDEDTGSGDGEGAEADGGQSHDGAKGQSHGGNSDHRGQSSVSTEDDDSKEQEGSPHGRDGDNSSEENGTEEGDRTQATQDNQKLSPKDDRDAEGGVISQAEACPSGKSQGQVRLKLIPLDGNSLPSVVVPNNSRQTRD